MHWRLTIYFVQGVEDLILSFSTRDAAVKAAIEIVAQGYVRQDRSKDQSNYDTVIYPISQVRSLHIFEK